MWDTGPSQQLLTRLVCSGGNDPLDYRVRVLDEVRSPLALAPLVVSAVFASTFKVVSWCVCVEQRSERGVLLIPVRTKQFADALHSVAQLAHSWLAQQRLVIAY